MVKLRGGEAYPIYFGASAQTLRLAGDLRRSMTSAEKQMWEYLRNKKIKGFCFRRQHPVNDFIVDFFCYEAMLAVEIDGAVHEEKHQAERDEERTKILEQFGIKTIRFTNREIENDISKVIAIIESILKERTTIPSPVWGKGREGG